jgi:hypothetical protein
MKSKWIIGLVLMGFLLSACQSQTEKIENTISAEGEPFEIYLIDDEELSGKDLADYKLDELPLVNTPLITTEDIDSYNWEYNMLNLKEETYADLLALFSGGIPMEGVPLVVVSKGERMYAAAFWSLLSSLSFDGVAVLMPMDPTNAPLIFALGYPDETFFTGEDPRHDPKIKNALDEAGLLYMGSEE